MDNFTLPSATIVDMRPELTVRTWQGVLAERHPEWLDSERDDYQEAVEAKRLHELRGLVVGQVAEIEGLLRFVIAESRGRTRDDRPLPRSLTAGRALEVVKHTLSDLGLAESYQEQVALVRTVIHRRNRLVHAQVHIGFSRVHPDAPLQSVIALLLGDDQPMPAPLPPQLLELEHEEDDTGQADEGILKRDLQRAYQALDAMLDIWEAIERRLPPASPEPPST